MALLAGTGLMLAACAGPVVLGINLGTASTIGSLASTAATGKGLGEHAVSAVADKDCRFLESIIRKDRQFCEEYGSPAQKEDFAGVASWFEAPEEPPPTMLATVAPEDTPEMAGLVPAGITTAPRTVETTPLEPQASPAVGPVAAPIASAAVMRIAAAPPVPRSKPAPERAAASGAFAVQVGTFAHADNAEALARKLRAEGYQARITRVRGDGRRVWSVIHLLGFHDAASAERAAAAVARDHDTEPGLVLTRA